MSNPTMKTLLSAVGLSLVLQACDSAKLDNADIESKAGSDTLANSSTPVAPESTTPAPEPITPAPEPTPPAPPTPEPTTPAQQACNSMDNLLIKGVTSTGEYNGTFYPAKTIDNNLDTESRWSANGIGRTITFDLGTISTVRRVSTAWYQADIRQAFFDVQTSTDNNNWDTVLDQATAQDTQAMIDFEVRETDARYVRIVGLGNSASNWNSLIEADVLGCGIEDETTTPTTPITTSTTATLDTQIPTITTPTTDTTSTIALLKSLFDIEGGDSNLTPYKNNNSLEFDALTAQHVTPNGGGWRHELKMAIPNRKAMSNTTESLSAIVTPELSIGTKTIVAQYHASGTGTLVKVYVADTRESNHDDSIPNNGIFDVYVRLRPEGASRETIVNFGTIQSGESFDLTIINTRGLVTVAGMGKSETIRVADSDAAYLKFGNYMQAQDAATGEDVEDSDDWASFFTNANITKSVVTFTNVSYTNN